MNISKFINPVRVGGTLYSPVHFSPMFALICLSSFFLFNMLSPFIQSRSHIPNVIEWGFLSIMFVGFSLGAGFLPPFLASLERHRGFASVYGALILLSLVPILGLWINPNIDISPVSTFFQVAGAVGVLLLFLWPPVKKLGTHDADIEEHKEWILHNAVASLLRRGEITTDDASIANPFELDKPPILARLQRLHPFVRQSIEREMIIEEAVQANKRRFGLRR